MQGHEEGMREDGKFTKDTFICDQATEGVHAMVLMHKGFHDSLSLSEIP